MVLKKVFVSALYIFVLVLKKIFLEESFQESDNDETTHHLSLSGDKIERAITAVADCYRDKKILIEKHAANLSFHPALIHYFLYHINPATDFDKKTANMIARQVWRWAEKEAQNSDIIEYCWGQIVLDRSGYKLLLEIKYPY